METATIASLQARIAVLEDLLLRLPMNTWGDNGAWLPTFPALQHIAERKRQRENDFVDANDEGLEQLRDRPERQNTRHERARLANTESSTEALHRHPEPPIDGAMGDSGSDVSGLDGVYVHTGPANVVTEASTQSIHQSHMLRSAPTEPQQNRYTRRPPNTSSPTSTTFSASPTRI